MIGTRIALADLRHEWLLGLCQVLAAVAVLTPLLVLYGLKYGVVEGLLAHLREDPESVQIRPVGDLRLDPRRFAEIAAMQGVRFAVAEPRTIAQMLFLQRAGVQEGLVKATVIPTAQGDPLRGADPPQLADDDIVVTTVLAQRLGVSVGDEVEGSNLRHGADRRLRFRFKVVEVTPPDRLEGLQALVSAANVDRLAAFLDGYAIPEFGVNDGYPLDQRHLTYETIRLYAADIDSVEPLVARLTSAPYAFDVRSALGQIRNVRSLDAKLSIVFRLLAVIGGGYLVALAATSWANVVRKRKSLAVLRLLGAPRTSLLIFPIVQASLLSFAAMVVSLLLFLVVATVINSRLAPDLGAAGPSLCRLPPWHVAEAGLTILAAAAISSFAGGWQAARLQPVEGLRDA